MVLKVQRRTFFSFHYKPDAWRASQVRNMGVIEGNKPVSDNAWETITGGGDKKIREWIDGQLEGKSCAIVLIGANTAGRKWIDYEIKSAWNEGKGLLGVYVHNLEDQNEKQSGKGKNPFVGFEVATNGFKQALSGVVTAYDPPFTTSKYVYADIKEKLARLVEDAIRIRGKYGRIA